MKQIQLTELLEAGSHFGHQVRRWNPSMKKYIYGERDGVHIFDLSKTKEGLEAACEYAKEVASRGGIILFVGSKRQASQIVKDAAVSVGMPYMVERWVGGLLTNFGELQKRIRTMKDLKERRERGDLKKYTKWEQMQFDKQISRLEKFFAGVENMDKIPEALFIVDTHREEVAVREASRTKVKVIGLVDTNADPSMVDYIIPTNDDAERAIEYHVKAVTAAIADGQGKPMAEETAPVAEESAPVVQQEKAEDAEVPQKKKTAAKKKKAE